MSNVELICVSIALVSPDKGKWVTENLLYTEAEYREDVFGDTTRNKIDSGAIVSKISWNKEYNCFYFRPVINGVRLSPAEIENKINEIKENYVEQV